MAEEKVLYIHSRCCNAAWFLVWRHGRYDLECAKCGKSAGTTIKITGPELTGCECEYCSHGKQTH